MVIHNKRGEPSVPSPSPPSSYRRTHSSTRREHMMETLTEGKIYNFELDAGIFDYGGKQKATKRLPPLQVRANNVTELKEIIWRAYHKHLIGHVTADDEGKTIVDAEKELEFENCQAKFFRFHDTVAKKRPVPLSEVTVSEMNRWSKRPRGNNVDIRVFPYGYNIDINQYQELQRRGEDDERDRAGAIKEAKLRDVARQLRDKHDGRLVAFDIAWKVWANHIVTHNSDIETAVENAEYPPEFMINSFRIQPPGASPEAIDRTNANAMAIRGLTHVKQSMEEMQKVIDLYLNCLKDDGTFIRLNAESREFASCVSQQEDTDHNETQEH
eukprot:gb/GECH01004811.1/.p1 GENE.gb/GECH01004811.1/~~gb/GECH01004811.1/.p1  ORF type:complete len:327 (+),score=42.23 gb/GECH01004811.1/:1-981(+)